MWSNKVRLSPFNKFAWRSVQLLDNFIQEPLAGLDGVAFGVIPALVAYWKQSVLQTYHALLEIYFLSAFQRIEPIVFSQTKVYYAILRCCLTSNAAIANLFCRVSVLVLLRFLDWSLLVPSPLEISGSLVVAVVKPAEHVWTCMNMYENVWTSMNLYDNVWTCMNKYEQAIVDVPKPCLKICQNYTYTRSLPSYFGPCLFRECRLVFDPFILCNFLNWNQPLAFTPFVKTLGK